MMHYDVKHRSGLSIRPSWLHDDRSIVLHNAHEPFPTGVFHLRESGWQTTGTIFQNLDRPVLFGDSQPVNAFRISTSLYSSHHHPSDFDVCEDAVCEQATLALACGFGKDAVQHLYIVAYEDHRDLDQCVGHVDVEHTMGITPLEAKALLAGWHWTDSNLAGRIAVSPGCRRIAASMWEKVLIWDIDPAVLCHAYPEAYFSPRDYNEQKLIGRIRPIKLPSQGVVYQLHWVDRWNLYGVTDRGLAHWNIGPNSTGKQDTEI